MSVSVREGMEVAGAASDQYGMAASGMQAVGQTLASAGPGSPMAPYFRGPGGMNAAGNSMNSFGNHMGGAMSILSLGTGLYSMLDSSADMDDRIVGGGNVLTGGIGTAGYGASLAGANTGFWGGLSSVGGAAGLGADAFAASTWGAGAASGGAAAGTALATGGAVLGAGLAGYGIGKYGMNKSAEYGWFGENADGSNADASDWASDNGVAADSWVDEATGIDWLGDVAGGAVTIGSSVAALPGVVGGAVLGAGSAIGSFVGGIFSW